MQHSEEAYRAYLGKNADHYLQAWQSGRARMHLPAFLIGGLWLGYRKLYFAAGLLAFVVAMDFTLGQWLLSIGVVSETALDTWARASAFVYAGLIAALSHRMVLHRADHVIKVARQRYIDPVEQLTYIASKGQTSWLHALLGLVYVLVLTLAISMIVLLALGLT